MHNGSRTAIAVWALAIIATVALSAADSNLCLASAVPVLTYHYNKARTGTNKRETILTPDNVNVQHFGKLFSVPVDSGIYAQPLYVPGVPIPGLGRHNVVYVATQHNRLYALDADDGATLWVRKLGPYQRTPEGCAEPGDIGIVGTPVIDLSTNTMYAVAATLRHGTARQELNAIDIRTGLRRSPSPVIIKDKVAGIGLGSVAGTLKFKALREFQRPALLLDNGMLYIGFAVHCDFSAYSAQGHGWLFAYDATTLQKKASSVVTPNGYGAGIWASGGGPAADAYHNIYFSTGDGTFDVDQGGIDYGDSVIKLSPRNLSPLDYFTPKDQAALESNAADLGSGGILLLPDQSTSPRHLLVTAGKQGIIYLINRRNLGHYNPSSDDVVQEIGAILGLFGTPTYWNERLYFAGSGYTDGDPIKEFAFSGGHLSKHPISQSVAPYPYPGAVTVVSANGRTDGILWALQHGGTASGNEVLHAYDAANLAHELYNSDQAGTRDLPGRVGKQFESIIVVNGKVYVPTGQPQLAVFGLLPQ